MLLVSLSKLLICNSCHKIVRIVRSNNLKIWGFEIRDTFCIDGICFSSRMCLTFFHYTWTNFNNLLWIFMLIWHAGGWQKAETFLWSREWAAYSEWAARREWDIHVSRIKFEKMREFQNPDTNKLMVLDRQQLENKYCLIPAPIMDPKNYIKTNDDSRITKWQLTCHVTYHSMRCS